MQQTWHPQAGGTASPFCFWTDARESAGLKVCDRFSLTPSILPIPITPITDYRSLIAGSAPSIMRTTTMLAAWTTIDQESVRG